MPRLQKLISEETNQRTNTTAAESLKSSLRCNAVSIKNRSEKVNNQGTNVKPNKISKTMSVTQSDGNIMRNPDNFGVKQKTVNKVKSWNTRDNKGLYKIEGDVTAKTSMSKEPDIDLVTNLESLNLSPNNSEDTLFKSNWLRARGSLESLLSPREDKKAVCGDIINSKSVSFPSKQEKFLSSEAPHSDLLLGNSKASCSDSIAKILTWDPWDKLGRKNKKDSKRRKCEKSPISSRENSRPCSPPLKNSKDRKSGDETNLTNEPVTTEDDAIDELESYVYQPYRPKNTKSVLFTNEVLVVYFTGEEVVGQATEPLKKELDQQIRNKEMRRGHVPATITGKRQNLEDYMSTWYKK